MLNKLGFFVIEVTYISKCVDRPLFAVVPTLLTLVYLWRLSLRPLNTCDFRLTTRRALSPVSGQCGQTCPHSVIQLVLNQNPATPTHCDSKTFSPSLATGLKITAYFSPLS